MKLIIDIDEEKYNNGTLVNYFNCYSKQLDEIIYNGIPLTEEIEKIKEKILEENRCMWYSIDIKDCIDKYVAELKGENNA